MRAIRLYRLAFDALVWQQERQAFANYLSITDRYSAQTNFDSENTIGGRFQVNRAHQCDAAFLPTVIKQQQWQIGDSLLNSKFGWLVNDLARDLGIGSKLRVWFIRTGRLTCRCGSVKGDGDDDHAH